MLLGGYNLHLPCWHRVWQSGLRSICPIGAHLIFNLSRLGHACTMWQGRLCLAARAMGLLPRRFCNCLVESQYRTSASARMANTELFKALEWYSSRRHELRRVVRRTHQLNPLQLNPLEWSGNSKHGKGLRPLSFAANGTRAKGRIGCRRS